MTASDQVVSESSFPLNETIAFTVVDHDHARHLDSMTLSDSDFGLSNQACMLTTPGQYDWDCGTVSAALDGTTFSGGNSYTNFATVTAVDSNTGATDPNTSSSVTIYLAQLSLGISASPQKAHAGDLVTYQFTVTNTGASAVDDIALNIGSSDLFTGAGHITSTSASWLSAISLDCTDDSGTALASSPVKPGDTIASLQPTHSFICTTTTASGYKVTAHDIATGDQFLYLNAQAESGIVDLLSQGFTSFRTAGQAAASTGAVSVSGLTSPAQVQLLATQSPTPGPSPKPKVVNTGGSVVSGAPGALGMVLLIGAVGVAFVVRRRLAIR